MKLKNEIYIIKDVRLKLIKKIIKVMVEKIVFNLENLKKYKL